MNTTPMSVAHLLIPLYKRGDIDIYRGGTPILWKTIFEHPKDKQSSDTTFFNKILMKFRTPPSLFLCIINFVDIFL